MWDMCFVVNVIPHSVMKLHFSLSNGRPLTPFTFTIQPHSPVPFTARFCSLAQVISKVVSLYQGAFVGVVRAPVATSKSNELYAFSARHV